MSKIATLEVDGQKIELPVITGSENESAIDINKLRDLTGIITLDHFLRRRIRNFTLQRIFN
jgi:citrate synthase